MSDSHNLYVQAWRNEDGSVRVVNYMPRKESCAEMELTSDEATPEMWEQTARYLENLAKLVREFAAGKRDHVYYHDDGMEAPPCA